MSIEFGIRDGVGLATPKGAITATCIEEMRGAFNDWHRANPALKDVVLDCAAVEFIDSSGLGLLIAMLKRVAERGGELKLAGITKKMRMVIEITRTHKIFRIYDTVEAALAAKGA